MIRDIAAEGKLKGERIVYKRGAKMTQFSFDGHMLDEVNLSCTLLSKEDCLID